MCRKMYSRNFKEKYSITAKLSPYVSFVRLILIAIQSRVIYLAWSVLDKTKQRRNEKRQRAHANQATVSSFQ
jgi:hypothetical protein